MCLIGEESLLAHLQGKGGHLLCVGVLALLARPLVFDMLGQSFDVGGMISPTLGHGGVLTEHPALLRL